MVRLTLLLVVITPLAVAYPKVSPSWAASVRLEVDGVDPMCPFGCDPPTLTTMVQDDARKMREMTLRTRNKFAPLEYFGSPKEWFNVSQFDTASRTYVALNNLCYPDADMGDIGATRRLTPATRGFLGDARAWLQDARAWLRAHRPHLGGQYEDMFGWVPASSPNGSVACLVDDGPQVCEVWSLASGATTLTLVALDDRPVEYLVRAPATDTEAALDVRYVFLTYEDSVAADAFTGFRVVDCYEPPSCATRVDKAAPPRIVTGLDFFIFHPANEFDLAGQDIADALGDAFFVCETLLTGAGNDDYEWVSKYTVDLDLTVVGQYQNCNGYPPYCLGTNDFYVGKEAALGLGYPAAGQCEPNELTGNWYSLPVGGQCHDGDVLGVDCTWRAERVKTVFGSCLIDDRDYLSTCALDGRAPFLNSADALQRIFLPEQDGGCPAIPVINGRATPEALRPKIRLSSSSAEGGS